MNIENDTKTIAKKPCNENTVKAIFLASLAGISAIVSFTYAYGSTKKKDPVIIDTSSVQTYESGVRLAFKALKWGTIYAFTGWGVVCFGVWKLSGAKDMKEFREKMGLLFPKVPKKHPEGRSDFESLTDLLQYLNDEYSSDSKNIESKKEE